VTPTWYAEDPALEEVRDLLDVLQVEEAERVLRVVAAGRPSVARRWSAQNSRYLRTSATDRPATAAAQQVLGELGLAVDRLVEHGRDVALELGVEEVRLLAAHGLDQRERERHVRALVAEDPVRCRRPGRAAGRASAGSRRTRRRRRRRAPRCRRRSRRGSAGTSAGARAVSRRGSAAAVSSQRMQKSALRRMDGMVSTAANAWKRSSGSGR
jgi:hypothetical protein